MNKEVFRLVIIILGITIVSGIAGIIGLSAFDKEIPGVLENLAVAALAGIVGLLARSPGAEEVQAVNVVNSPSRPVPVEEPTKEEPY